MARFCDRLSFLRKREQLTQAEFSQKTGIGRSAVSMYERGRREPDFETLEVIADYFNVDMDYLIGKSDIERKITITPSLHSIRISVLGSVPAGVPIEAVEDVIDWEDIPAAMTRGGKEYFALRVSGDSMYPKYLDGDIVIVHKTPVCDSGDDCVVYVNGYDATLKTVVLGEDGSVTLRPININYAPRTFTSAEVAELPVSIAGVVAELRRKVKS